MRSNQSSQSFGTNPNASEARDEKSSWASLLFHHAAAAKAAHDSVLLIEPD
jgi:hypothetical protein